MKNILALYHPCLIRPIIRQMLYRMMIALIIMLAWYRFGDWNPHATVMGEGFFCAALIFLTGAWFNYLKFDGMSIKLPFKKKSIKDIADENKQRRGGTIGGASTFDYVDEEGVLFAELTNDEKTFCKLFANLIPAVIFLTVSLVVMFLL
ncbi:MAG: hypothetical protein IJ955_04680 [Oscillospiraceae bacterium]|nr:hypothetical protein [Oscillospiraceae bacterium]